MGNDILTAFIERKRKTTIRSSLLFVKYLVDDKAKLNKTLEKMVSIYYRDFYLQENIDFKELDDYFITENFKDVCIKACLLSSIRFYKENGIEDKIKEDIRTIVLITNAIYLSLVLGFSIDRDYDKESPNWLELFLKKYQNKMRMIDSNKVSEFEQELVTLVKKEESCYRKFFKLLDDTQYQAQLEPLLDYSNGYLVRGTYTIKMLSRYSSKEVEQVFKKKEFYLEQFLITIERISIHFLKQILAGKELPKYFLPTPIELLDREKYITILENISSYPLFKNALVFVFDYRDILHHTKSVKPFVQKQFLVGVKNLEEVEMKPNSFEYVSYVFTSPKFLEKHSENYSLWEDKDIRFIIWEGELS